MNSKQESHKSKDACKEKWQTKEKNCSRWAYLFQLRLILIFVDRKTISISTRWFNVINCIRAHSSSSGGGGGGSGGDGIGSKWKKSPTKKRERIDANKFNSTYIFAIVTTTCAHVRLSCVCFSLGYKPFCCCLCCYYCFHFIFASLLAFKQSNLFFFSASLAQLLIL